MPGMPRSGISNSEYIGYGSGLDALSTATKPQHKEKLKSRITLNVVCASLCIPVFIFVAIVLVFSFSVHYYAPFVSYLLAGSALFVAFVFGQLGRTATAKRAAGHSSRDPFWYYYQCLAILLAVILGILIGDNNYYNHLLPYYRVMSMNAYPAVDPTVSQGQEMMDAGRVVFTNGSFVDTKMAMNFKDTDSYCVAPITVGNDKLANYDFWAVGLNCCNREGKDYECGELDNPSASSGLRLLVDEQRDFYRLAVNQAEATFDIKAKNPLFFLWVQDPTATIEGYDEDGMKYVLMGTFSFFSLNVIITVLALALHSKRF